jgi:hypothetical protein
LTSAAVCAFLQYTEPRFKLKNRPPAPKPYPPDRTAVRESSPMRAASPLRGVGQETFRRADVCRCLEGSEGIVVQADEQGAANRRAQVQQGSPGSGEVGESAGLQGAGPRLVEPARSQVVVPLEGVLLSIALE